MSTGGEVANALVCKTSIRGFNSLPVLQYNQYLASTPESNKTKTKKAFSIGKIAIRSD